MSTTATKRRTHGGLIWITRMDDDGNDHEVCRIAYAKDGAAETFHHAVRAFWNRFPQDADLSEGDLIVTLLDADEDTTADDPLRIPAENAEWFLDVWLQVPASWRTTYPRGETDARASTGEG